MSDEIIEGEEKGDTCNRNGCLGIIDEHYTDVSCSCHINAPCNKCEHNYAYCPVCDWEPEQP